MNFSCSNEQYLRNALKTCLNSYEKGSTVNISYEVIKQTKTLKQLGFIFGGLIKALNKYFDNIGYNTRFTFLKNGYIKNAEFMKRKRCRTDKRFKAIKPCRK